MSLVEAPRNDDKDSLFARTAERVASGMTAEAALAWPAVSPRPVDPSAPGELPAGRPQEPREVAPLR
jgi:hypothetical protein